MSCWPAEVCAAWQAGWHLRDVVDSVRRVGEDEEENQRGRVRRAPVLAVAFRAGLNGSIRWSPQDTPPTIPEQSAEIQSLIEERDRIAAPDQ